VTPGPDTPMAEVSDALAMLVGMRRVPGPDRWVDSLVARSRAGRERALPHRLF
jgi:hypothetical protein